MRGIGAIKRFSLIHSDLFSCYTYPMKKSYSYIAILLLTTIISQNTLAFCRPFWDPQKLFIMEDVMKVFVHHAGNIESVVVQPAYKGTIKDFALVFATPNLPKVVDAPKGIFDDLETITNPFVFGVQPMMMSSGVIESSK